MKTEFNNLSEKQKELVRKFHIEVKVEENRRKYGYEEYVFLIGGSYYQQRTYHTQYDAYVAGVSKALEVNKHRKL